MAVPDQHEAHYGMVVREMAEGLVVPLLGAGVNVCDRPSGHGFELGRYLPSGGELAEHLATSFFFPEADHGNLLRISQFVVARAGSGPLYDELRKLFNANYPPTRVHEFFASIPRALRQVIVTTNYDDALERAFDAAGEEYDVIWYIADGQPRGKFWHRPPGAQPQVIEHPRTYDRLALEERTTILKIHGAVDRADGDRDSYVITEDHYIDYLTKTEIGKLIPAELLGRLRKSHFLFLGYSLQDWNLRVILHRIWGQQPFDYKSWAIQKQPSEVEQELWKTRNVDVLDIPLDTYVAELAQRVAERPNGSRGRP